MLATIFSISSIAVKDVAIHEGSMNANHLIMMYILSLDTKEIATHALIDCGSRGYAFIGQDFTDYYKMPLHPLKTACALEVIDG
jgi:hypothetical protein